MDIRNVIKKLKQQPIFTTYQLATYYPEANIKSIRQNLHNWQRRGEVIQLKKGLYVLTDTGVEPAAAANRLYEPSYLSLEYALSFYQLLPDVSFQYTSITTRKTKRFTNELGRFVYRTVKPTLYFGFDVHNNYLLAQKEKALLDYLYLNRNDLVQDPAYLEELRLQNLETLDPVTMHNYLARFSDKKLFEFWSYCKQYYES